MTGLLILAHAPLASALRAVAGHVYPEPERLAAVLALDVPPDWDAEQVEARLRESIAGAGHEKTLVLVDVCGATPCNVARRLAAADPEHLHVAAGLSVPMLWRALCYGDKDLDALTAAALKGGLDGALPIVPEPEQSLPKSPCAP